MSPLGSTETASSGMSEPVSSSAPRTWSTSAGQVSSQVEYTNVTATGLPRYCAIVAGSPSWSRSSKSGAVAPGGRTKPAQPPALTAARSSPRAAIATPITAAAAQTVRVIRA